MKEQDYDHFSRDYDRFVNWEERLSAEMPFIREQLNLVQAENGRPLRVLDTACGTGMHTIALAKEGYAVAGSDISPEMIKTAQKNAHAAREDMVFKTAGFGDLQQVFQRASLYPFDALLCLGNSLPHLLSTDDILAGLRNMAACLRSGGMVLLQNRNFDAVMAEHNRWQGIQSYKKNEEEWLFVRFYDFDSDGLITFNIVQLHKGPTDVWSQHVTTTRLFPLKQAVLLPLLKKAGFHQIACYGKMGADKFDPKNSGNLVIAAIKK